MRQLQKSPKLVNTNLLIIFITCLPYFHSKHSPPKYTPLFHCTYYFDRNTFFKHLINRITRFSIDYDKSTKRCSFNQCNFQLWKMYKFGCVRPGEKEGNHRVVTFILAKWMPLEIHVLGAVIVATASQPIKPIVIAWPLIGRPLVVGVVSRLTKHIFNCFGIFKKKLVPFVTCHSLHWVISICFCILTVSWGYFSSNTDNSILPCCSDGHLSQYDTWKQVAMYRIK